jgi:hypothetical protein
MVVQRKVTDITSDDVNTVVSDFEAEGCKTVKIPQADGNWTVLATCPDGPSGKATGHTKTT